MESKIRPVSNIRKVCKREYSPSLHEAEKREYFEIVNELILYAQLNGYSYCSVPWVPPFIDALLVELQEAGYIYSKRGHPLYYDGAGYDDDQLVISW